LIRFGAPGDAAVPRRARDRYTLVHGTCFIVLWVVKASVLGILFPLFIALCVPVRLLLKHIFERDVLKLLDDYDPDAR
jgi:hypothetical protein